MLSFQEFTEKPMNEWGKKGNRRFGGFHFTSPHEDAVKVLDSSKHFKAFNDEIEDIVFNIMKDIPPENWYNFRTAPGKRFVKDLHVLIESHFNDAYNKARKKYQELHRDYFTKFEQDEEK